MAAILIVIVNYRVGALCVQTLASLAAERGGAAEFRVTVVDNASGDGSDALLETAIRERGWSDWVRLIRSPVNGGFSAGNNLAIREALAAPKPPRFVHLLNPDTLVRPGAITALQRAFGQRPQLGIVGSRLAGEDGARQHSCFRFPSWWSELDGHLALGLLSRRLKAHAIALELPEESMDVDWVSGASMMIRREVFEEIGLLDEEFFMYFEELDFALRARNRGWSCRYEHASEVVHLVGRSSLVDHAKAATRPLPTYWYRSRRRFWVKHHGLAFALWVDATALGCHALRRLRAFVQRKPQTWPSRYSRGLLGLGCSRGGGRG